MGKVRALRNLNEASIANLHYMRGDEAWRQGDMRSAFRHFFAAAEAGMEPAFQVVAQFYNDGEGVRFDESKALYWYRRASEKGNCSAANNIGCILRDRGKSGLALRWFKRAVTLGDADANLEIAKIHVERGDLIKARPYLDKTVRSSWATEQSKDEARRLLKRSGRRESKATAAKAGVAIRQARSEFCRRL